ncbi:MAG: SPOR domain-containing protein [Dysgonamonadaceae bacterium]|jgi:cell division septation protein DedD|nr:SPOR domain-containing protein [Dysgonamonadaceae bacterium]
MKSKILLLGFAFALLFTLGSCKSKESAYKTVYEKAQQVTPAPAPATKPEPAPSTNVSVKKEKVVTVEGSGMKRFGVVIGSFINKTNASSLKETMQNQGYPAILVQNQQDMYRVIVESFDDRASATAARDALKRQYYPDFQDAWLLEQEY